MIIEEADILVVSSNNRPSNKYVSYILYVCIHVYCMCECVCLCACACACACSEVDVRYSFLSLLMLLFEAGTFPEPKAHWLDRLTWHEVLGIYLHSSAPQCPIFRLQRSATMFNLLHGCWTSDFVQQELLWLGHLHSFTINSSKNFVLSNSFYNNI